MIDLSKLKQAAERATKESFTFTESAGVPHIQGSMQFANKIVLADTVKKLIHIIEVQGEALEKIHRQDYIPGDRMAGDCPACVSIANHATDTVRKILEGES